MSLSSEQQTFISLMHSNRLDEALSLANELNLKYPEEILTYNMLGDVLLKKNDLQNAALCYQASLSKVPQQTKVLLTLGKIYDVLGGHTEQSFDVYRKALESEPENTDVLCRVGEFLSSQGHFSDAQQLLHKACKSGNLSAYSHMLRLYERQGDKHKVMSLLKTQSSYFQNQDTSLATYFDYIKALYFIGEYEQLICDLESISTDNRSNSWQSMYYKYLGDALEKQRHFKQALNAYKNMNRFIDVQYSPDYFEQLVNICKQLTTQLPTIDKHYSDIEVIFIVGMPRTGTSLLEKIIATDNAVVAGGELLFIDTLFQQVQQQTKPLDKLLQDYYQKLEKLTTLQESKSSFVTDKMPTNFFFIGLIRHLFPKSKIVYNRRNAFDTCFSIYKQNFTSQVVYSSSFQDILHFLSLERSLMNYWMDIYPEDIFLLDFESLLTDFNTQTRQLFDFLNLPWHENLDQFYTQRSFTHTASYDQVKQPINSSIIAQYNGYRPYLKTFIKQLDALKL